ncbi:MAG TPA: hypothetical protein VGX25_21910 [Actinophytocola sp.]|uniref:hypothetical protein n=1 Tax=Actinophytocola sp. TaxID=1872138 RepID=UPI002DDD86A4|nr:hypothetical protein [Actinophytocola sp.]HEV2782055.1 hypothetical protein [Actinophytocola sp.]
MDNVIPIRKAPEHLYEAVVQVWEDFAAGRIDGGRQDGCISYDRLGAEAWSRLPADRRTGEYPHLLTAYVTRVLEEREHVQRQNEPFNLAELIVRTEYSYAGVLGDPAAMDDDQLDMLTGDVIAQLTANDLMTALRQALRLASPVVLQQALDAEQARAAT